MTKLRPQTTAGPERDAIPAEGDLTGIPTETALRILVVGNPAEEGLPLIFRRLRVLPVDLKIFPLSDRNPWRCPRFFEYLHCAPAVTLKSGPFLTAFSKIPRLFNAATRVISMADRLIERALEILSRSAAKGLFGRAAALQSTFHLRLARKRLARIIVEQRPGTIFCLPKSRDAFQAVWKELVERGVPVSDWESRSAGGFEIAFHRDVVRHAFLHRPLADFAAALERATPAGEPASPARDDDFSDDPHPGGPKILFVGEVLSAHAHAWVRLFDHEKVNVRFFSHHIGFPPDHFRCRTYVTAEPVAPADPWRRSPSPAGLKKAREISTAEGEPAGENRLTREYLANVIRTWRPDIIDTIGMNPCGEHYFDVRNAHPDIARIGRWILQARQSDLAFAHKDQSCRHLADMLEAADVVISDNRSIRQYIQAMDVTPETLAKFHLYPGTGGIDVDEALSNWRRPPSERRLILWPKCYDSPWAMATPVLQALQTAWPEIKPARVVTLMTAFDMAAAIRTLPEEMRAAFTAMTQIPQADVMKLMGEARLMVAPSLVDGLPLSTVEAMASGAVPLISPLPSLTPVFTANKHVLYADNGNPEEIAAEMIRAMTNDGLVDRVADANMEYVREIADRSYFRPRILDLYKNLAVETAGRE